jgi:MSHA pilin protein MshC
MSTSQPFPQRWSPGFTLVELITVMLIVGILAVVVVPRLGLLKGYDEVGYRDKARATLEYARKSAVAQRRNVLVTLAGNNLTLTIDNVVPEAATAGTYPRALALPTPDRSCGGTSNQICAPGGVTLTGPATLSFTALGAPNAAGAYSASGEAAYTITVEAETGYVH